MSYFSLNEIKNYGDGTVEFRQKNWERYVKQYKTTVFLSHSHQDKDIVGSVVNFLLNIGILVYVDWLDPEMPQITSGVTATKIKDKIDKCDRFVVLVTEKSRESKWVPWEVGYADAKKSPENIGVLVVKRYSYTEDSEFDGIEYMQLYRRIKPGHLEDKRYPSIFEPGQTTGHILGSWM